MIEPKLREELSKLVSSPVQWDCPLGPFTSFGIGGPADALVRIEEDYELGRLLDFFTKYNLNYCFIGRGTNLLVSDAGFAGVVLLFGKSLTQVKKFAERADGTVNVRVDGGCSLAKLSKWCVDKEYSGLEFVTGIPGSLGGAVVMNAGAWGEEIADVIESVTVFSSGYGKEQIAREELDFVYRKWNNQKNNKNEKRLLLSADIILQKGTKKAIEGRCREYLEKRRGKQPKGVKNAGSFFKNPPGDSAGRLIEAAGLKGENCGDAFISEVHANFLVNRGKATAEDVKSLMGIVVDRVKKDSGVVLEPEVHFL